MNSSNRVRFARAAFAAVSLVVVAVSAQAAPTSVNVTGAFQSEVGCSSDFDPSCALTNLLYDSIDDVWQLSLSLPAKSRCRTICGYSSLVMKRVQLIAGASMA